MRTSLESAKPRPKPTQPPPRKGMIIGLVCVIAAAGAWLTYQLIPKSGTGAGQVAPPENPADAWIIEAGKMFTDLRFERITCSKEENGQGVVVAGAVARQQDLIDLKTMLDGISPRVPIRYDVRITPR